MSASVCITAEMLKYGVVVVKRMLWMCNLALNQSEVPEDWKKPLLCLCIRENKVGMTVTAVRDAAY